MLSLRPSQFYIAKKYVLVAVDVLIHSFRSILRSCNRSYSVTHLVTHSTIELSALSRQSQRSIMSCSQATDV